MRLKHVLFSSLFLSAAFVACTNEDLVETQAPSMDVENAISLGEGFTITGTKMAMDPATKSIFEVNGSKLLPYWEEDDVVGAAWFNMVTSTDDATGMVTGASEINSSYKFFSNTDFNWLEFVGGDKTQAKFEANTNVMAGAYVIYYPWDENVKQVSNEIPVTLEFPYTVDLAEGHEFDAVSENMFSYGVAAFVPGGRQTSYFETKQVPVLYRLKLGATNLKLVDLATDPLVIDRIIIEAKNGNNTVLTTAGTVVPPTTALDKDDYNAYLTYVATDGEEGAPLPEAVYASSEDADDMVGHYTIELANSDQPAYQIAKLDELTTGNIVFSALPITKEATSLTVKIVTKDGLNLLREYTTGDEVLKVFNAQLSAAYKANPSVIKLDVYVDTQKEDETIYTAGQFQAAWAEAIKSSTKENPATLTIADPVILKDVELVNDNPDADITIQSEDGATLQVKSINWEEGKLTINSALTVDGDITNDANLTVTKEVTANHITLNGNTTMTIAEMESLLVRSSGKVNLTLPIDNAEKVGKITVRDGGELTLNGGYLGDVEIVEGTLTLNGDVHNTTSFTGTLAGEGKFINEAGATATLSSVGKYVVIENKGASIMPAKAAGVINTTASVTFVKGSINAGIINATAGTLTVTNLTLDGADARVNIEKGATIAGTETTSTEGWYVVKSGATVSSKANISRLAYSIMTVADLTAAKDGCNYFIDADLKANTAPVKSTGTVYFNANQTLKGNWTMTVNVIIDEDVTFSTDVENGVTYTQSTGTLTVNGSLYVKDGVTLNAGTVTAATFRNIDADDFDTQVQATVK